MTDEHNLLWEPEKLKGLLGSDELLIIDLSKAANYTLKHIPGAVSLDYQRIIHNPSPVTGFLPDLETLSETLSDIGWRPDQQVIVYDEEGGAKACRLIWTLHALGCFNVSLLNGGIMAWLEGGYPVDSDAPEIQSSSVKRLKVNDAVIADKYYIIKHLEDNDFIALDARTVGEYAGKDVRAKKGGHIPGAIHFEWTQALDRRHCFRLQTRDTIIQALAVRGVTPDKNIVTYCQAHHRSAHTYFVLRWLGYEQVRGYHGAWSDWGNADDMPIETSQNINN